MARIQASPIESVDPVSERDAALVGRHLAKLRVRGDVSAEEEAAIRAAIVRYEDRPADDTVVRPFEEQEASAMLLDGIMCRYKDLRGGQRQITELQVAGDFVDLHSFTLGYLDHGILTLTRCRLAVVPHDRLRRLTEQYPRVARLYWLGTNADAAIHREWEVSLGRRPARARLAALFSELQVRLATVGLADEGGYALPLTQADLGECMGLTNIHVNRTLRELREERIVEFQRGRVKIFDRRELWNAGEFDPRYLYLEWRGR